MNLNFTLGAISSMTGGYILFGKKEAPIRKLSFDSRSISSGDYFVAIKGKKHDAHKFVPDVLARGAGGVIISDPVRGLSPVGNCLVVPDPLKAFQQIAKGHRDLFLPTVVGITGSNGKTTTKEMISHLLKGAGKSILSTKGNLNSQIGLPLMLLEISEKNSHVILEMGASEKGNINRLCELASPKIGVITNIGRAHLEFFGSLENVLEAKWELIHSLSKEGLAVLNADDPMLSKWKTKAKCAVLTYGLSKEADVRAENIKASRDVRFDLIMGGVKRHVRVPFPGQFNVYNVLASFAVGLWEKIPLDVMVESIQTFVSPKQRMEVVKHKSGCIFLLDAYNANPDSMMNSLESFQESFSEEKKIVVLGRMNELGSYEKLEHELLGEYLAKLPISRVCFLGPGGEWVQDGFKKKGGRYPFDIYQKNEDLISNLRDSLRSKTAILFKASRGVQLENIYDPLLNENV